MFPAYVKFSDNSTTVEPQTSKEFLQNPSYDSIPVSSATVSQQISSSSESSSDGEIGESKTFENYERPDTPPKIDIFYLDSDRKKEYLKLDTLPNRATPFYKISRPYKRFAKSNNKSSFRRYFKVKRLKKEGQCKDPKRLLDEKESRDEEMRIYLIKNTQDVEKWIDYIKYKVSCSKFFFCIDLIKLSLF